MNLNFGRKFLPKFSTLLNLFQPHLIKTNNHRNMKATLLFIAVFLGTLPLSAQELVLEKEVWFLWCEQTDSLVYKEKNFHQLKKKYGEEYPATIGYFFKRPSDESPDYDRYWDLGIKYKKWLDWLYLRVIPREIYPYIDAAQPPHKMSIVVVLHGLLVMPFFDREGEFISALFYVDKDTRDKITPRHLKEIYQNLKQIKVPEEFMKEIVQRKVMESSFNKNCFREDLYKRHPSTLEPENDPEWEALNAEFEKTSIKNSPGTPHP